MRGCVAAALLLLSQAAAAVDVQISSLTDAPDPAVRGGQLTFTTALLNSAADTATDVTLTFPLPATTTFVSVNNPACSHDGLTPGTVNCAFGNITGDGLGGPITSIDIVVNTTAATGPTIAVAGVTAATSSPDTDPGNNTGSQNTTIDDGADLIVGITDAPDPAVAGGTIDYSVLVQNDGPNDAATTTIVNTLPPGVSFVSAAGAGWSCSAAGQDVSCIRASVANGAVAPPIMITGRITGMISGVITDSVTVSSTTGDPEPNNNTTTEDTVVDVGADLAVTKSVNPDPVVGGQPATFTIAPRNNGPFDASSVVVTDTLPGGFSFVSASGPGWSCGEAGGTVTCTRATLAAGATDDITIETTAPASGAYTNTASISSATADPDATNDTGTISGTPVPDGADLAINKSKSPNPVAQGSPITSIIGVTNNGPQSTSGTITVTDVLSSGETFTSATGTNWSCSLAGGDPGGTVTCTYAGAPLAAGASAPDITVSTVATNTGTLTNAASVTDAGGTADGVPGNNSVGGSSVSTGSIADLAIVKSADAGGDSTLTVGESTISYTLVVTNNGPSAVGGVRVTDPVPGYVTGVVNATPDTTGVAVSDDSGGKFSCSTGATVTCNMLGGQSMANGEVVTFTVTVDRPLDGGALNNTATVASTELGDNNPGNNSDNASVNVDPIADVELQSKSVTPGSVAAGTNATYVLTVANNGPATAEAVTVQDVFTVPAGRSFSVISVTPSAGSCAPFVTATLDCTIGDLDRDETQTVTVVIRPDWDVNNDSWVLPNTATASTTTPESDAGNNAQSASLNVTPAAVDLLVNKTDLVDPAPFDPTDLPSNLIVYRVDITNRGPSVATGVTLQDDFTPQNGKQLTFQCDDAGSASCAAGTSLCDNTGVSITGPNRLTLSCALPDLEASTSLARFLFFRIDSAPGGGGDTHNNLAGVSANEDDTTPTNDTEAESTSVRVKVDVGIGKSDGADPVSLNEPYSYTLTVDNNGPGDSEQTTVTDTLPAGMELTGAPVPSQGSCSGTSGDTTLSCALGTVANGANATVTVPVRVTVVPPGGTITNSATVSTFGVDTISGNNTGTETTTVNAGTISGTSFDDQNDDGTQDPGDNGIPGVTITLSGTDQFGNPVNRVVTTGANGDYTFDGLPPSNGSGYRIEETQPPGFVDGLENAGDPTGGNIVPGSTATDFIDGVVLGPTDALTGYDFGNGRDTSLGGTVYADENNDGVLDPGEARLPGVEITLTGTDDLGDPVMLMTTTAADGSYAFNGLRPGTYTVTETQPTAWADGIDTPGTAGGTAGDDVFSDIVLANGQFGGDYNFGERGSSLSGFVYDDANGNGIKEPSEVGIPGVTITLTGIDTDGNVINRVVVTGPDGSYRFTGLPQPDGAGYTITETQPPGVADGIDSAGSAGGTVGNDVISGIVFPGPGTDATGYNFGEGAVANPGRISGRVYFDDNHNRIDDEGGGQPGWTVQLVQRGDPLDYTNITLIAEVIADANGDYAFEGLSPGDYEVIFRHPDNGTVYGRPESGGGAGNTDSGTIRGIMVGPGSDIPNQDLPLDPAGVIYDSITRQPVAGARVDIIGPPGFDPALHLVGGIGNASQLTGPSGQYQFLLLPTAPIGEYQLAVTSPPAYVPGPSTSIPACTNTLTVDPLPAPALVQAGAAPPAAAAPIHDAAACAASSSAGGFAAGAGSTQYYLGFILDAGPAGSADLINNHIPLDPVLDGAVTVVKTTTAANVSRGDLVPYTLRVRNNLGSAISDAAVRDQLPPGFKYRPGSGAIDGVPAEPVITGRLLSWPGLTLAAGQELTVSLVAAVGAGVAEANYVNQAWVFSTLSASIISNIGAATVRVVPDAVLDCAEVIGKVFDDRDRDGYQDDGEAGIPNVRLATVQGLLVTTDDRGRYHIACVKIPDAERGSNFIMKLDVRTLPTGYKVSTENPRVVRLTRGKITELNFGADLDDEAQREDSGTGAGPSADADRCAGQDDAPFCVDQDLAEARIQLRYDGLEQTPWLNVHAAPNAATPGGTVRFETYSNYVHWIDRAEIEISRRQFPFGRKTIATLPVAIGDTTEWTVPENIKSDRVAYVLRVYDRDGRFDETRRKPLQLTRSPLRAGDGDEAQAGYGENAREKAGIPVAGGAITVNGEDVAPGSRVEAMGQRAPVDDKGRFAIRQILPPGPHDVGITVVEPSGASRSFERQANIAADDWFYVALADFTAGYNDSDGPIQLVTGNNSDRYDNSIYIDGRLAFYLKGRIQGKYLLTAAADTEERPLEDMFSNLTRKDPRNLLRRLDADRFYPVYGDDSTTLQDAPTQGRFYVRVERGESEILWGNFQTRQADTELIRYNRGLYGAKLELVDDRTTASGQQRGRLDYFAADAGSLPARDEFRGTGGSLYFLNRQDVTEGSERVWVEVRDKDTGLTLETRALAPFQDYDINYLQGRVLLTEPLASTGNDNFAVRNDSLSGHLLFLVVTYEYTPGLSDFDDLVTGGRGRYWLGDHVRLGLTHYQQDSPGMDQDLLGGDVLLRWSDQTWLKLEMARSDGPGSANLSSIDGGYLFAAQTGTDEQADALHLEGALRFEDLGLIRPGNLRFYWQDRDNGFSGPGQLTGGRAATRKAVELDWQPDDLTTLRLSVSDAKGQGTALLAAEADVSRALTEQWAVTLGLRYDDRDTPLATLSPTLNREGARTDLALRVDYTPRHVRQFDWSSYAYVQGTLDTSGERVGNDRVGVGGTVRLSDRFTLSSEVSTGERGFGAQVGGEFQRTDATSHYLTYGLDPDRTDIGYRGRQGQLTAGTRYRFNDSGTIFSEHQLRHGDGPSGLLRAFGLDYSLTEQWTFGARGEFGRVTDPLNGELKRRAMGGSVGYHEEGLSLAASLEYRQEDGTAGERETWLFRTNLSHTLDENWRFLGRLNTSFSDAADDFLDGEFIEAVTGFAYRPVEHDAFNMLFRYRFFYDLPSPGQLTDFALVPDYAQRSHIWSADATYDLLEWLSIGGKVALKSGELRGSRVGGPWIDSNTVLGIGRLDLHLTHRWDAMLEGRILNIDGADDRRAGMLIGVYRHVGKNAKFGLGYNFTDFSDDLTDLDYDNRGLFFNLIGKF